MDPVSVVVAALVAGAVAGAQSTATEVVKDAYAGLKALVRRCFAGRASGEVVLENLEDHPEAWRGALQAELVEADVAGDPAVVRAAQQVLALLDPEGCRAGKYQVDARGAQGVQIGDQTTMTNTFTTPPPSV